jgi:two-component system, OmpR family, sensor histidine kinase KdpD
MSRVARRYGIAVGVTLVAAGIRLALDPWLSGNTPLLFFLPAVMLAAWWAGVGPAILAIALSVVCSLLLFIEPHGVGGESWADILSVGLFVIIMVSVAAMTARLQDARTAAEASAVREEQARMRAEETLHRYERLLKVRDSFTSMLAHELRTPLTVILGDARLLTRPSPPPAEVARELLTDIASEAERLHTLVEDLLVLNRDVDQLDLSRQPVALEPVLRQMLESPAVARAQPPVRLEVRRPIPLIAADPSYLRQLLSNLLSNARKYGGGEPVDIIAERDGDVVCIRVADRGQGVPPGDEERIFELFYRSPLTSGGRAGAGVGLFVCRRLAEAMDGRVWAEPRAGGGTVFVVELPQYEEGDETQPTPSTA